MANPNDMDYGVVGMETEGDAEEEMMACGGGGGGGEKKRRLSAEQVRALERSFEVENKPEFDPGSEGTLAICLTHASRTLFSGSWAEGKEAPS